MSEPLVSILIPCYNAEQYVGAAIESSLEQTHPSVEVVVVDDGSTDGSTEVIASYGESITYELGSNQGGCAARNRALDLSGGQFVMFLDADDLIEPTKIEQQLPELVEDRADIVLSKVGLIWPPPRPKAREKKPHPIPSGDPFIYFLRYPIQTAAPLHRRSFIEQVGGFRVGLSRGQEADFHLRLGATNPRLSMVDETLVWVRMHDGPRVSKTPVNTREALMAWYDMANDMLTENRLKGERQNLVAERLLILAVHGYRAGFETEARAAFDLANRIDRSASISEPHVARWLRSVMGAARFEAVRKSARAVVKARQKP